MNKHTITMGLLAMAVAGASGCAIDESLDYSTEFRTSFGCEKCGVGGSNSAHVNNYAINTLGLDGQANDAGVRIVGIKSPANNSYDLRTEGDRIFAWDSSTMTIAAIDAGLIGWKIQLGGSISAEIVIMGYDATIPSWAAGASPISAYAFAYDEDPKSPGELVNVCPDYLNDPTEKAVTLLRGVVIDEDTKEVSDADAWMTIACFGNAAAKMKLANYSRFADYTGTGTAASRAQRQATIRMITADYCGDGTSFTSDGVALDWLNRIERVTPQHNSTPAWADVEAIWDEDGAICLNTPRVAEIGEVEAHCTLPACDEQMLGTVPHEWVTWRVP